MEGAYPKGLPDPLLWGFGKGAPENGQHLSFLIADVGEPGAQFEKAGGLQLE